MPVENNSAGFNVGHSVAIGITGTDAETRTVGVGSLKLNKPLPFARPAGKPVVRFAHPVMDTTPPTTVANLGCRANEAAG